MKEYSQFLFDFYQKYREDPAFFNTNRERLSFEDRVKIDRLLISARAEYRLRKTKHFIKYSMWKYLIIGSIIFYVLLIILIVIFFGPNFVAGWNVA